MGTFQVSNTMKAFVYIKPCTFSSFIKCNHPSAMFSFIICLLFCLIFFYFLVVLFRKSGLKLKNSMNAGCCFSFLCILFFLLAYLIQYAFHANALIFDYSPYIKLYFFTVVWKNLGQAIFLVQVCKILYIFKAPFGKTAY